MSWLTEWEEPRAVEPREGVREELRICELKMNFLAALAGRCLSCNGCGCGACRGTGRATFLDGDDARLHPADAWTLARLEGQHSCECEGVT